MLPVQQFDGVPSANPMPPWTPQVWTKGPDGLVAIAQESLWGDQQEIHIKALAGPDSAISGSSTGVQNESDVVIDGTTPGDSPSGPGGQGRASQGRASQWKTNLGYLYDTEPRLAGWSNGDKTGEANPAA